MLLFLDCEWADRGERNLVSLALVAEDPSVTFYCERDPLPRRPTKFVRDIVYPLLRRGDSAANDDMFSRRLREFIEQVAAVGQRRPRIAYDYDADRRLFDQVYHGFGSAPRRNSLPADYLDLSTLGYKYFAAYEKFFREHPEHARARHNALTDANAASRAYLGMKAC